MHKIAVCDTIQVISPNECPFNEILQIGNIHTDIFISILFINDCSLHPKIINQFLAILHFSLCVYLWKHQKRFSLSIFMGIEREYWAKMISLFNYKLLESKKIALFCFHPLETILTQ